MRTGLTLLHAPLEGQKGRRQRKEAGKRTQHGTGQRVVQVGPLVPIRKRIGDRPHTFHQMSQNRNRLQGARFRATVKKILYQGIEGLLSARLAPVIHIFSQNNYPHKTQLASKFGTAASLVSISEL